MNLFVEFLAWAFGPRNRKDVPPMMTPAQIGPLTVSPDALELITESEISGRSNYEKTLHRPTWPGAASGVTIGIGYDVGYNTPSQVRQDWGERSLPDAHLESLTRAAGVKGEKARSLAKSLNYISIPWDKAKAVFEQCTLPRFAKLTAETFPGVDKLHPHIQGALLSLIFNRGNSLNGDRRREMRAIREHIIAGRIDRIPAEFRKMKRLWEGQNLKGLLVRRDAEADLVELGLAS